MTNEKDLASVELSNDTNFQGEHINPEPELKKAPQKKVHQKQPALETISQNAPEVIDPRMAKRMEVKEKWQKQRAENAKMVTGKFLFNECPGGRLKFPFREFPGDPITNYDLIHGQTYTIPLGVARHLNDRCAYPEYQHNLDGGKMVDGQNMYVFTMVNRTNFIPLDYTVNAGYTSPNQVSQVTYTDPKSSMR